MSQVVIIGCGVVGAAIAYELSQVPGLKITVLDKQPPGGAATKAALGVLMAVISHKIKGKAWQMRMASIQRYETLIPELVALTGHQIPFNRQGILMLLPSDSQESEFEKDLANWEKLAQTRAATGWQLEIWDRAKVKSRCPQINCDHHKAAVYSPQDRQVDPVSLTLALVEGAKRNGVAFHFGVTVEAYNLTTTTEHLYQVQQIKTKSLEVEPPQIHDVDWLVVSAGLGSLESLQPMQQSRGDREHGEHFEQGKHFEQGEKLCINNPPSPPSPHSLRPLPLYQENHFALSLGQVLDIRPVLGQAIHLKLNHPLGNQDFQPVITANDVHIVPCGGGVQATEYWIGATVEFPTDGKDVVAEPARLDQVMQQAIALCPALAQSNIIRTWSGLRPRPEGRPAPIIGHLTGFSNVLLATGHYRNGVLLAPATAGVISQLILNASF
jgi:glycine/D-amino acid oxidase-like deaminating enzyme